MVAEDVDVVVWTTPPSLLVLLLLLLLLLDPVADTSVEKRPILKC